MRIIYFHQHYRHPRQGGGTRSYEFARRLVSEGHSVTLIFGDTLNDRSKNRIRRFHSEGVNFIGIRSIYNNNLGLFRRIVAFLDFAFFACLEGVKEKGDLVFSTSTPLTIAIPSIFVSKVRRIPHVFEVRDLWPEMPIAAGVIRSKFIIAVLKFFEKKVYINSKVIIALSPGMKDGIFKSCPESIVVTIPNSVDEHYATKSSIKSEAISTLDTSVSKKGNYYLLYPGQLGTINGFEKFWPILESTLYADQKLHIVFCGSGGKAADLKQLASAGSFKKRIHFLGQLSKEEVFEIMKNCKAVLGIFDDIPEMEKNSSNKFFDAMAAGKPIIINYGGWTEELIKNNNIGIRVHNSSPELSAKKICQMISQTSRLQELQKNSKMLGQKYFGRDLHFSLLRDTMEAAVNEDRNSLVNLAETSSNMVREAINGRHR